ncbi:MAG: YgaP-like transmembrane domain [Haloarculaceae archaeon]
MENNVGGLDRTVRGILAVVLALVALRSLTSGKRATGLLAVAGAAVLATNYRTRFCGVNRALGIDTSEDSE